MLFRQMKYFSRLPIMQGGEPLRRNYCLFWVKERTNYYIEEFAETFRKLLQDKDKV
ncbi:MAG TPA: hypothetical protein H9711_03060 [Candidatus Mediterraneibacter intestinavium]|nr:hypothetical protein [Candidatus Mediterraneibacter intestinavium]